MEHSLFETSLENLGFTKHLMLGTGWLSTSSMTDAIYYYKNGRITINCTKFWTWFLDGEMRNDIAVATEDELINLLKQTNGK